MPTKEDFSSWVEGYVRAWNSNQEEDIAQLFSEDALYYTGPFDEPWHGHDSIIQGWLGRKDEPGNFAFQYDVIAVQGKLGVVRGATNYTHPPLEYANIWLITLNDHGKCEEFLEFWMENKSGSIS